MEHLNLTGRHIMTILNVTPDSFFEGSRTAEHQAIAERVREAVDAGATIIDVGGYSSRPGADDVPMEEEWRRVELGVSVVREVAPNVMVSVDTFRAEVARRVAEQFGRVIINDITAGEADAEMFAVVAKYELPYVAMHMRGTPQSMQSLTSYSDVVQDVIDYFEERIKFMKLAGIKDIILDPGFGFAKSVEQNYQLLKGLSRLCDMGYPLLVGVSRKSMIYKVLEVGASEALPGTIALNWEALRQGASILRVHDSREAVDTLRIFEKYNEV